MISSITGNIGSLPPYFEYKTYPSSSVTTSVEQFFAEERESLRNRLATEPLLAPFRFVSDALLTFLCGEKTRLFLTAETRIVHNDKGEWISGYSHHYNCQEDSYHPAHFEPFDVKGFWIPETEGELFSVQPVDNSFPLIRTTAEGREILFLIHPKSEPLFAPLIEKYASKQVSVPSLSLSSFRTLLIAIPTSHSLPQYAMVKVSLNEIIGHAARILSRKECAGSVATTTIMQHKSSTISFMQEDFSFVPNTDLLSSALTQAKPCGAGIIHRPIPPCLLDHTSKEYVIPLFALFGSKNRPLLDLLISQSQKTPTQFVIDSLLTPLADGFVDLLYFQNVSIEAHGQNLLLSLHTDHSNKLEIKLMYRDMGGVNCLLSSVEKDILPENLRKDEFFYFDTHVKDAADVLEGIANKILFNLTKQFFKSKIYDQIDSEFVHWKTAMVQRGFSTNWTSEDNGDAHQQYFTPNTFYRYGYFEKIFGSLLLETFSRKGIFIACADYHPEISYVHFATALHHPANPYHPCLEIEWFKELILQTYPVILKYNCMHRN